MIRYADDFVVLARYCGNRLVEWIEKTLETRMGLEINRQKTRIIDLRSGEQGVNFLGYTFRYEDSPRGWASKLLQVTPSKKALGRFRDRLRDLTGASRCYQPIPDVITEVNSYVGGWSKY